MLTVCTVAAMFVRCRRLFDRYIEVFRSNLVEMNKRSRPPPLMSARPGPYDRPGSYGGRSPYPSRSRMRGFDYISVLHVVL